MPKPSRYALALQAKATEQKIALLTAELQRIEKNLAILRSMRNESIARTGVAAAMIIIAFLLPGGAERFGAEPALAQAVYIGIQVTIVLIDVVRMVWLRYLVKEEVLRWRLIWRLEYGGTLLSSASIGLAAAIFARFSGVLEIVIAIGKSFWPSISATAIVVVRKFFDLAVAGVVGGATWDFLKKRASTRLRKLLDTDENSKSPGKA